MVTQLKKVMARGHLSLWKHVETGAATNDGLQEKSLLDEAYGRVRYNDFLLSPAVQEKGSGIKTVIKNYY